MRAILINPIARTVTEIDVTKGLDSSAGLYAHMRACDGAFSGLVECVGLGPNIDIWIDEEGNLSHGRLVWEFAGQRFTGPGIIACTDMEGELTGVPAAITPARVRALVEWTNLESTGNFGPSRETIEDHPIFGKVPTFHGGQPIFRERLLFVQAFNEPRGEGNGWEMCADSDAGALFYPCQLSEDEAKIPDIEPEIIGEGYRTRAEAEKALKETASAYP